MGSGGKGKKWRNAGGFNRNYRNDKGQNHNRQKGSRGKGGNRHQRQAHSRDNRKYDEDHGDEDYEENYYDEGEEALDVDVDEVCRSLKRLPDLQKDEQKKESRSLWYDYFDPDSKFEALLDNFPRGSEERRNLQSAFEDALPCFTAVQRTKISAKLSAEGFELEDIDNSGKQQGGKRQTGRQHSRDDEQSRGGNRKQQNAKLLQRRSTGPVGSREEDWNAGASKGRAGSNRLAARKVISFKEVPWQSKARKAVAAKADEQKKASSGNLQKIGEKSKLIAKASAANARKKFGRGSKGKWQDQGKGALKGITGANLIEVKWQNPLGVEDDEDNKDAAAKSPSPVRRGPAGRGRSMTAPAWMTTTSDPPPPAITDDSTAEREDAAKEKSGGRGSRNSPPPSIPKENGEKAGDVERDDRQSGRKGKGRRRSRSGGQQRRAVLSARRNSSQDEPDRQDDWNDDKSRNHRDSQKDDSWRSERKWERGGTYQKWKESKESWPTPAVEESESQVAKIATKFTCSRHNVERSFHRLTFSEDNKLVCRPGEPCRLQLSVDGDLIDSLECESVAANDRITVSLKGRRSPPPLPIADNLCVPERKRPKARRSRSPHVGLEDVPHSRPLAGITAKSSFAPPPLPPSDRQQQQQQHQNQAPQMFVPVAGQSAPKQSTQGQSQAPSAASNFRKGLQNKKIEKAKDPSETPSTSAPTPTPQAEPPKALSPMPPSRNFSAATEGTTAAAKGTGPAPSDSKVPRWPPNHAPGGQSSSFASSIKALNLEPMRANPAPYNRPNKPALRSAVPEPLPPVPERQNQQQNQAQNNQSQASPQPQQQLPSQQPAQMQQPSPQPQQLQPQLQAPMQPNFSQPGVMQMMPQMAVNPGAWGQPQPQAQLQPQQPSPAPSPTPQGVTPAPAKKVNKLKNAVLARPGTKKADGDEGERHEDAMTIKESTREHKDDSAAVTSKPETKIIGMSKEVCLSCGSTFAEDSNFCRKCGTKRPDKIEASASSALAARTLAAKVDVLPTDCFLNRQLMLRIWRLHKDVKHKDVQDLCTATKKVFTPKNGGTTPGSDGFRRRPVGLKTTDKGWQKKEPTNREEQLKAEVRSLLNKICPENLKVIVDRLAGIDLHTADELEFVIREIFGKALLEPHYCETYADMVFALRTRYPEFPAEQEGDKPHTFTRVLLNTCQNEFESLPTTFVATEEDKLKFNDAELFLELKKRKDKMLANMKFIGNLFLRQLLAVKVIGQVVHDLVGIKDNATLPEEHMIECVCELLTAIGHTLDGQAHGKSLMDHFTSRLLDLRRNTDREGAIYSRRIVFKIQDLLDLRKNNWVQKLFKEVPMMKDDIKKNAQKEAKQAARGIDVTFATQTAGVRPAYIDEFKIPAKPRAPVKEEKKISWDQTWVKKCFHYFLEDKIVDELIANWKKPEPTSDQKRDGVSWLCDIGFNDSSKEEMIAETLVILLERKGIDWSHLQEALLPFIEVLDDLSIDTPNAPKFVHSLFSKLFMVFKSSFQSSILSMFKKCSSQELVATVLIGILKKVHAKAGSDGVKRILSDQTEFVNLLLQAKGIKKADLSSALAREGL